MPYLLKTEPGVYSFAQLEREKQTIWDGVTNPAAVKNLRGMQPGDPLIIYHTGDEKRAVGTASVVSVDASDTKKSAGSNSRRQAGAAAGYAGGNQGQQAVCRLAAGAPGQAFGGAAQ